VVIPFAGSAAELDALLARLEPIRLGPEDTLVVADNRREADRRTPAGGVRLVPAPGTRSSYHARNVGAAAGHSPWLLFLDADVEWDGTLLDAYFEPAPEGRVAILAGTIEDAPLHDRASATAAERYAVAARTMSELNTLDAAGRPPYAQTANCMVRRAAFEAVGGFEDGIRSGGDADLCWRLGAAGWEIGRRAGAHALHRNRQARIGRRLAGSQAPGHVPAALAAGADHLERPLPARRPDWCCSAPPYDAAEHRRGVGVRARAAGAQPRGGRQTPRSRPTCANVRSRILTSLQSDQLAAYR
jgi:hypothetical protein